MSRRKTIFLNEAAPVVKQNTPGAVLIIEVVGAVLVSYGIYQGVKFVYNRYQTDKGNKINTDPKLTIKKGYALNGKPITNVNLSTIANDLYNSINVPFYGIVDQDRAVRTFLGTPYGQVKKLQDVYLDLFGQDLKKRLAEQLSDINFIKIKYWFQ